MRAPAMTAWLTDMRERNTVLACIPATFNFEIFTCGEIQARRSTSQFCLLLLLLLLGIKVFWGTVIKSCCRSFGTTECGTGGRCLHALFAPSIADSPPQSPFRFEPRWSDEGYAPLDYLYPQRSANTCCISWVNSRLDCCPAELGSDLPIIFMWDLALI